VHQIICRVPLLAAGQAQQMAFRRLEMGVLPGHQPGETKIWRQVCVSAVKVLRQRLFGSFQLCRQVLQVTLPEPLVGGFKTES